MKIVDIIIIIVGGLLIITPIITFYGQRYSIKVKKQEIIKLKGFRIIAFSFSVLAAIIMIGLSYIYLNKNSTQFIVWLLLGIVWLVKGIFQMPEIVILDHTGIKESKLMKWDEITNISKSEFIKTEIIIETSKKNQIINFYTFEKIEEFKKLVRVLSPVTYNLYLNELK